MNKARATAREEEVLYQELMRLINEHTATENIEWTTKRSLKKLAIGSLVFYTNVYHDHVEHDELVSVYFDDDPVQCLINADPQKDKDSNPLWVTKNEARKVRVRDFLKAYSLSCSLESNLAVKNEPKAKTKKI